MIDIQGKRGVIVGLQGSGKTELAKSFLRTTDRHLVYDSVNDGDYQDFRRYVPDNPHSLEELEVVVEKLVIPYKPDLFIIDESHRYMPNRGTLPPGIRDLNMLSRHYNISWFAIAQRPSEIHVSVINMAQILFLFGVHGRADVRYLNDVHRGLGDVVDRLPPFHFVVYEAAAGKKPVIHRPIEIREPVGVSSSLIPSEKEDE